MPEEQTQGPEGQSETGTEGAQTTGEETGGQPTQTQPGTTDTGTREGESSFFDPNQVPDELKPAYKQMQSAWTKKMQALSADKQKIEAYDAFMSDPIGQMQQVASRYGYQLTRGQAEQALKSEGQQTGQGKDNDWQPQNWNEVLQKASDMSYQRLRKELTPLLGEIQTMKKQSVEKSLDEIDPMWRQYEDKMVELLGQHKTLASDPALLYKLAVPQDVLESRATQQALKKMEAKGKASQISGSSTTTKKPATGLPDKPLTFQEAVEAAKKKLAEDGVRPGG